MPRPSLRASPSLAGERPPALPAKSPTEHTWVSARPATDVLVRARPTAAKSLREPAAEPESLHIRCARECRLASPGPGAPRLHTRNARFPPAPQPPRTPLGLPDRS